MTEHPTDYGAGIASDPFPQYLEPDEQGEGPLGAQLKSEKDLPDGYAGLDGDALLDFAEIPTGLEATQVAIGTTLGIAKDYADTKDGLHVAADDPHTQYDTSAEAQAKVDTHTAATDPHADRAYADSISQGLELKASVKAASTANLTLSGTQTVDGIALIANDRILVKDQTLPKNNGIYVVASGAWSRGTDADSDAEVNPGMFTFVEQGSVSSGTGYVLITPEPITLGTTDLAFSPFSSAGVVTAGAGLTKTGSTLDVVADSSITVTADQIAVTSSHTGSTHAAIQTAAESTASTALGTHVVAADPHTGYQKESEKGTASGYAALNSSGIVPNSQLPIFTLTSTFVVATEAAMLALVASPGDVAIRTDLEENFVLTASPASTLANWHELFTSGAGLATHADLVGHSLAVGHGTVANPYVTSSVTAGSTVVFCWVRYQHASSAPTVTSISGLSGTWSEIANVLRGGSLDRMSLWMGTGCTGSGALTITPSATPSGNSYNIIDFTGIDETDPIVATNTQTAAPTGSVTSISVTPAGLSRTGNAFVVGALHNAAEGVTPLSGATEINDDNASGSRSIETNYLVDASSTMGGSWSTATTIQCAVGVEVNALLTPLGELFDERVPKSVINNKGELFVGSADNTVGTLGAPTQGQFPYGSPSATFGVIWKDKDVHSLDDYGADPTCTVSSSDAMDAMLADLLPTAGLRGTRVRVKGAYLLTRPAYLSKQAILWDGVGMGNPANYSTSVSRGNTSTFVWGRGSLSQVAISTATHSGTTVTVTTSSAHGFTTGDRVTIQGVFRASALSTSYNGAFVITVTGSTTFTYTAGSTPATDADAATGTAGFSMFIVEQSRFDHFRNIFFQGDKTYPPLDLLYFNKVSGSVGENGLQGATDCQFGSDAFTNPVSADNGPPFVSTAKFAIRFGGVGANNDKWTFHRNIAQRVGTGFRLDNTQSVWGSNYDFFVNYADYGIVTSSNTLIMNPRINRVRHSEIQVKGSARVSIHGWSSERLGNGESATDAMYLDKPDSGSQVDVWGGHWLIPVDYVGTNIADIKNLGGAGGVSLRNVHIDYAQATGRPQIKARGNTSSVGAHFTIEDCPSLKLADLDVAADASGAGVNVTIRMAPYAEELNGVYIHKLLTASAALSTTVQEFEFRTGNVVVGNAALATTATDGFLYIPTCAGTPTGTPTAHTGMLPIVLDSTNHKLYAYNSGWKSVEIA